MEKLENKLREAQKTGDDKAAKAFAMALSDARFINEAPNNLTNAQKIEATQGLLHNALPNPLPESDTGFKNSATGAPNIRYSPFEAGAQFENYQPPSANQQNGAQGTTASSQPPSNAGLVSRSRMPSTCSNCGQASGGFLSNIFGAPFKSLGNIFKPRW